MPGNVAAISFGRLAKDHAPKTARWREKNSDFVPHIAKRKPRIQPQRYRRKQPRPTRDAARRSVQGKPPANGASPNGEGEKGDSGHNRRAMRYLGASPSHHRPSGCSYRHQGEGWEVQKLWRFSRIWAFYKTPLRITSISFQVSDFVRTHHL